jgi:hypothetical protein
MFNSRHKKFVLITASVFLFFAYVMFTLAASTGRAGCTATTSNGCGACHGSSSSEVTVTASSATGNFSCTVGGTLTITVTVNHPTLLASGVNIAVKQDATSNINIGTLTPGTGQKLLSSEIVHSATATMVNGKAEYTFTWRAPANPGTYALRAVGSADVSDAAANSSDKWNWMPVQNITVTAAGTVSVTSPNGGETWCGGTLQNITWNSTNFQTAKIELSTNGGSTFPIVLKASTPAPAGGWAWQIADSIKGTQCRVRVSDATLATTNDASNSNFTIKAATIILTHPVSDTICNGSSTFLFVKATGENLHYKWRRNDDTLTLSNLDTLWINNADSSKKGKYDVIVNGDCSTVESNPAYLSVFSPAVIVKEPDDVISCQTEVARIRSGVDGDGLVFTWYHKGIPVAGQYDSIFVINNVTMSDSGSYQFIVKGYCDPPDTSKIAYLHINNPPQFTVEPQSQIISEGSSVTFTTEVKGYEIKYLWYKGGKPIASQKESYLALYNVKLADSVEYQCQAFNNCGNSFSQRAKLTVLKQGTGPVLTLNQGTIDFGTLLVDFSKDTTITGLIKNTGDQPLTITGYSFQGIDKNDFMLVGETIPITVQPGTAQSLKIRFAPSSQGAKTAQLSIVSNSVSNPKLNLKGFGGAVSYSTADTVLNYGSVMIGNNQEMNIKLTNSGTYPLEVSEFYISDTYKDVFQITSPQTPVVIDTGKYQNIIVKFTPKTTGSYFVEMLIKFTGTLNPQTITLVGKGTANDVSDNSPDKLFSIIPNPFIETVEIKINVENTNDLSAGIYDLLGNKIFNKQLSANNVSDNRFIWDGKDMNGNILPSGAYSLVVKNNGIIIGSARLVIVR